MKTIEELKHELVSLNLSYHAVQTLLDEMINFDHASGIAMDRLINLQWTMIDNIKKVTEELYDRLIENQDH